MDIALRKRVELISKNFKIPKLDIVRTVSLLSQEYDLEDLSDKDLLELFDKEYSKNMNKNKIVNKVMARIAFTNPDQYNVSDKFTETETLAAVRQDIIAELDAINVYEAHISAVKDPELKKLLEHIVSDEKEHVSELQAYLKKHDAVQRKKLEEETNV